MDTLVSKTTNSSEERLHKMTKKVNNSTRCGLNSKDFVTLQGGKENSLKALLDAKALADRLIKARNDHNEPTSPKHISMTNHQSSPSLDARYGGFLSEGKDLSENLIKFMSDMSCLFYRTIEYGFFRVHNDLTTLFPLIITTSSNDSSSPVNHHEMMSIKPDMLIFTLFHATTNTATNKSSGPIYWGCSFGGKPQKDDKIYTGIVFTYHPRD